MALDRTIIGEQILLLKWHAYRQIARIGGEVSKVRIMGSRSSDILGCETDIKEPLGRGAPLQLIFESAASRQVAGIARRCCRRYLASAPE